jgi:hypothetical protein
VIQKNPLGISIIPSFMKKSLEKQGIEVTSLNIVKDLCDKHIDNIPLHGKNCTHFFNKQKQTKSVHSLGRIQDNSLGTEAESLAP